MRILEGEAAAITRKRSWCFWSTTETIQNEVPCGTAILETLIAVPLYWWIALHIGVVQPLLISVMIAPFVLLRSEASVALGVKWFLRFENNITGKVAYKNGASADRHGPWAIIALSAAAGIFVNCLALWYLSVLLADVQVSPDEVSDVAAAVLYFFAIFSALFSIVAVSIAIISNVMTFIIIILSIFVPTYSQYIRYIHYIFRKLSPLTSNDRIFHRIVMLSYLLGIFLVAIGIRVAATLVYLRSGLEALPRNFRRIVICTSPAQIPELVPGIDETTSVFRFSVVLQSIRSAPGEWTEKLVEYLAWLYVFTPAWFYRFTIKSTAWFWWPLAFLGDELQKARNPTLLRLDVMDSLWAKTSIVTACASLLAFVAANFVLDGAVLQGNPLLTPLGYLLLVDWTLRPWQAFALVASALSVVLVVWLDYVSRKYRIAQDKHDTALIRAQERKFGWIERLARLRLLFVIVFWCLVGAHAILYLNSNRCWFSLPPKLHTWAQNIYGDRLPPDDCSKHNAQISVAGATPG
jgi:hypothetical protein